MLQRPRLARFAFWLGALLISGILAWQVFARAKNSMEIAAGLGYLLIGYSIFLLWRERIWFNTVRGKEAWRKNSFGIFVYALITMTICLIFGPALVFLLPRQHALGG